jgi:hypothetical protein
MTANSDIESVSALKPNYLRGGGLGKYYGAMPKSKGFAFILDDNTERLWLVKVRPRMTWHGGATASAFMH